MLQSQRSASSKRSLGMLSDVAAAKRAALC
jgi:hypothetical protein